MNSNKSSMNKVSLITQIKGNPNLLSLPQVLSEILKEVGKEDFSAENLAKIILKDPSLTSRILKISNSSFYHRLSEITTVHQAISVLGVTTVKCLALSSSIFHPDKIAFESGVDPKAFFSHVLSTAAAAEKIATVLGLKNSEEAFIAGLLHDLGIMYFLYHHPNEYRKVIDRQNTNDSLLEAEIETFEVDHAEIGGYLADALRLPEYIKNTIGKHHCYNDLENEDTLSLIVKLADLLASDKFSGFEINLEVRLESINRVSKALQLTKEQVDEISFSLLPKTVEAAEYLGIDIGDVEEMLTNANKEIWKTYLIIENLFKERQELSKSLLEQERERGSIETRNIAMATLSHYINNATMAIYGRTQLMRMFLNKGKTEKLLEQLPTNFEVIDTAIKKIVAVLEEMKEISPINQKEFYDMSRAMDIDDRLKKRLELMNTNQTWDAKVETFIDE